jgi:predicted nuclease with TOPRIM domain
MDKVALLELIDRFTEDPEAMEQAPDYLAQLGVEMAQAKAKYEEAKAKAKELKKAYDELRHEKVPEAMVVAGLVSEAAKGSYSLPGGGKVILTNRFYASVKKPDQPTFMDWLRENGHEDLIKETVHSQTLTAWAREQAEAGNPLPPEVAIYVETTASIRK